MGDAYLGEIRMFGGAFAPSGWLLCDGQALDPTTHKELSALLGTAFSVDGKSCNVPDLRGRLAVGTGRARSGTEYKLGRGGGAEKIELGIQHLPRHSHRPSAQTSGPVVNTAVGNVWADRGAKAAYSSSPPDVALDERAIAPTGGGGAHDNVMPSLAVSFMISLTGPSPLEATTRVVTSPMLAEIRLFAANATPTGWVPCDGRELDIADNQALYSIMGDTFGGNSRTRFNVPDLRGRTPIHAAGPHDIGSTGGTEAHELTKGEMPKHTHEVRAGSVAGSNSTRPAGRVWAPLAASSPAVRFFGATPNGLMSELATTPSGGGEAHSNMQPFIPLVFCLNVRGIFPNRA